MLAEICNWFTDGFDTADPKAGQGVAHPNENRIWFLNARSRVLISQVRNPLRRFWTAHGKPLRQQGSCFSRDAPLHPAEIARGAILVRAKV